MINETITYVTALFDYSSVSYGFVRFKLLYIRFF